MQKEGFPQILGAMLKKGSPNQGFMSHSSGRNKGLAKSYAELIAASEPPTGLKITMRVATSRRKLPFKLVECASWKPEMT